MSFTEIRWRSLLATWSAMCVVSVVSGQSASSTPPELPVVRAGLIRWWPEPLTAREEVTGTLGHLQGLLPQSANEAASTQPELGPLTGWVVLEPGVTNEVFTVSAWVRPSARDGFDGTLFFQESPHGRWLLEQHGQTPHFLKLATDHHDPEHQSGPVQLTPEEWNHVAVTRTADHRFTLWLNGRVVVERALGPVPSAAASPLLLGNADTGDRPWQGAVREVAVFDRVLSAAEIQSLHTAGMTPSAGNAFPPSVIAREVPVVTHTKIVRVPASSLRHRWFTASDGLPGNDVQALLLARDGYLWISMEAGLVRFDGRKFEVFSRDNTPAFQLAGGPTELAEDEDGTLWIATYGGLATYREGRFTGYTNGLPQGFVQSLAPTGDGRVWLAAKRLEYPRGPAILRRYDPATGESDSVVTLPGNVLRLTRGDAGLWIATDDLESLLWLPEGAAHPVTVGNLGQGRFEHRFGSDVLPGDAKLTVWRESATGPPLLASLRSTGLPETTWQFQHRDGQVRGRLMRGTGFTPRERWHGGWYGLLRETDTQLELIESPHWPEGLMVSSLVAAPDGGVWVGSPVTGLHYFRAPIVRMFTQADGLPGNLVQSTTVAPDGSVLVSMVGGLARVKDDLQVETLAQATHFPGGVFTLPPDRVLHFIGNGTTGFAELTPAGPRYYDFPRLSWYGRSHVHVQSNRVVWATSDQGVTWWDTAVPAEPTEDHGRFIVRAGYGRYLTSTNVTGTNLPPEQPAGILAARDGSVWVGSWGGGLSRIHEGRITTFTEADGLPGPYVGPAYEDEEGTLWIGGQGLTRYRDGRFQTLQPAHGLPETAIFGFQPDLLGHVWLPGRSGLHRVRRSDLDDFFAGRIETVPFLTLGVTDGLLVPGASYGYSPHTSRTPDGRIWMPTLAGLAMIDPVEVAAIAPLPRVLIQNVLARRQSVFDHGTVPPPARLLTNPDNGRRARGTPTSLELPAGSGENLELRFTGISLTAPERVRYQYRLEGNDADWSEETELPAAFYTNLRPGDYQFHVRARDTQGSWNEPDTVLALTIRPYFHQTTLFHASVAGGLAVLLAGLVGRRLRRERRLAALHNERRLAAERARIARDMHDELGAGLTRLSYLGDQAPTVEPAGGQTAHTARELLRSLDEIVWTVNPRKDRLEALAGYLTAWAADFLRDTDVRPGFDVPVDLPDLAVPADWRHEVFMIFKESLRNVLRHACATEVRIRLRVADDQLELTIADNGIGLPVETRQVEATPDTPPGTSLPRLGGNGLANLRARAATLRGRLEITSESGGGTRITLRAPLPT